MWTMKRKYSCPYRTKHRTKEGVFYYCIFTNKECNYSPKKCPIKRRMENGIELVTFFE